MKRILYIATSNIYLKTGGGIANLALLNSLLKDNANNIDVITYEEFFDNFKVPKNFYLVPSVSSLAKLKNICMGRVNRFTPWLRNFLKQNGNKYSHCIINSGLLGEYVELFHKQGIKVAIIHHNYECEFQVDNKRPSTLWGLTDFFVKRSERASYLNSDYNFFLSQDDMNIFHRKYTYTPKGKEFSIGIFEPTSHDITNLEIESLKFNNLAICGSLNSVQTRRGLFDFHNKYLPILDHTYSNNYNLKIAGRNPGKDLCKLFEDKPCVTIIPNPKSMTEVLKGSSIFICPTNVGGGIKLRILDGLKLGMPILTHAVSARGYNVLHKYPWFQIYEDEETFRRGLLAILNEISTNHNLRKEILEKYRLHFSFETGDSKFRKLTQQFLSSDD